MKAIHAEDTSSRLNENASLEIEKAIAETQPILRFESCDSSHYGGFPVLIDANTLSDASMSSSSSVSSSSAEDLDSDVHQVAESDNENQNSKIESEKEFLYFRANYLLVVLVIMLADGLQGTHLYVLYEGYGYSVASLYCLGFITGAVTTPITGPMIDKIGRKKAALLYCALEMWINMLEQYPFISGLIVSRMVGGVTTNLLNSVFETWLDSEYRQRGFAKEKYEILMRDSVVVSNLAAIVSGYLAHGLAEKVGPVGPFQGAVTCTGIALVVVALVWTENYGSMAKQDDETTNCFGYLKEAAVRFRNDSRTLRVGIIQGLTMGSTQVFIFLWSPTLQTFAKSAPAGTLGLDKDHAPAYGLIFGSYMAAGVVGSMCSAMVRKAVSCLLSPRLIKQQGPQTVAIDGEGEVRPLAVEFLAAFCYILCAGLLSVPFFLGENDPRSFSIALTSFLTFEVIIGVFSPCEGIIRSIYIPSDARATMMTLPTIIVNVAVALGVVATNVIAHKTAFAAIAVLMAVSAILQLSLVSKTEWDCLLGHVDHFQKTALRPAQSLSMTVKGALRASYSSVADYSTGALLSPSSSYESLPDQAEDASECDSAPYKTKQE